MGDPVTMAVVSTAVSTVQKRAHVRAQQRAQTETASRQIEAQRMQQERREKELRDQSKREQATARASFGARGVTSTGGSANALLQGIRAETDEAIADDRRAFDFGVENLRANQSASRRASLLESRNSIMNTVVGTGGKIITELNERD